MTQAPPNPPPDTDALLAGYRPDFSLDAGFYSSDAVYQKELEEIFFRHWLYAGHVSQLPEAGHYFLLELERESIILTRDHGGIIRAFANVCRHRGSRICTEAAGKVGAFVCPYHAWSYALDGRLRSRRAMPADFERARYGLKPVRCEVFHGLIFITLDDNAPDLLDGLKAVDSSYEIYALENTKVALQETYRVNANWKLAVENFMECYHCAPAHTEYARCHTLTSLEDNAAFHPAMLEQAAQLGYRVDSVSSPQAAEKGAVLYYYARNALYPPHVTGSRDGKPLAPLLGNIKEYGGGVADVQFGPVSFGLLYADHAVLYRFVPRGVQATDMDLIWLVNKDAEEGADYDLDELAWLWRVTSEADKRIIANNQHGVNSRFYEPGPLSTMEAYNTDFIQWYLAQIA